LNETDDVTDRLGLLGAAQSEIVIAVLQKLVGRRGNRANQAQGRLALNGVSRGTGPLDGTFDVDPILGSEAHHFADDSKVLKSGL
jgi:hypothetical protein